MNTLILCNGQIPPESLFEEMLSWADLFIAADGGGNSARSLGVLPDIVIGDLDSFKPQDGDRIKVIHNPDQETNDLEKALSLATKREATNVHILGATGLRLDHTLKNISVLKQFNGKFEHISFHDEYGITKLLPSHFSEAFPVDTTISLFPLSGKVTSITTEGLKYPLDDDFLENGMRDGSSNSVVSSPVKISHKKGDLLLFIAK